MAGLRELKSRLSSIETVGQLSGAMRTVSAAKYSRVSNVRNQFLPYGEACKALMDSFGPELSQAIPQGNPEAPRCYVVIAGNRGLCGGYNVELLNYATDLLGREQKPYRLVALGKRAESGLQDAGFQVDRAYSVSDVPAFEECSQMLSELREDYMAGEISQVHIIYQTFRNMLSQTPGVVQVLPIRAEPGKGGAETLFLPDRETLLRAVALRCVDAVMFSVILEAASGAQAATLVAMRSAYDNAQESILALETQISRKRQSDITASVIETSTEVIE